VSKIRVTLKNGRVEDHEATDWVCDKSGVLSVTGPCPDGQRFGNQSVAMYQAAEWAKVERVGDDEPLPHNGPVIA
jgi:hypothetical protein